MPRKLVPKGHEGLIPLERLPKSERSTFWKCYKNPDAYEARCRYWLVGQSADRTDVAGYLWELEELAHKLGMKDLKWSWHSEMLTIPPNEDNSRTVSRFEYIQIWLQWRLLDWVGQRRFGDLKWLAEFVETHARTRFLRVELPLATSRNETKPTQLTKLILSKFLRISSLSILPSELKRDGVYARIPTREYLKKVIKKEWERMDKNPDTINKEWSRALKALGLDGLPLDATRV